MEDQDQAQAAAAAEAQAKQEAADAAAAAKAEKAAAREAAKIARDAEKAEKQRARDEAKAAKEAEKAAKEAEKQAARQAKLDEKTAKETAKTSRVRQNGVLQRDPASKCGQAWAVFDQVSTNKGSACTLAEAMPQAEALGLNPGNVRAEYAQWRKFWGIPAQPRAKAAPAADPAPAEQEPATAE